MSDKLLEAAERFTIESTKRQTLAEAVFAREHGAFHLEQAVVAEREALQEAVLAEDAQELDHRLRTDALPADIELDEVLGS